MLNPFSHKPVTRCRRVGVVGLLQAGKTVLLTSLVDHLNNHDPGRLPIGRNGTELSLVQERPIPRRAQRFDFERYRADLGEQRWPAQSESLTEYRGLYVRDDFRLTQIDLSLLDMPGERLADMVVATHRRFADWSDAVLRMLRVCPEFRQPASGFLSLIDNAQHQPQSFDVEVLLHEYRLALARLIEACMPIVTPSAFLIDPDGNRVPDHILDSDAETRVQLLAGERFSGLSADQQFAPLPANLRKEHPQLARHFSKHYRRYRRFVLPFAKRLRSCDTLLILIDVAMLLEGGPGMLNANSKLIEQVLLYADPGFTRLQQIGHRVTQVPTLGWLGVPGIRRIAVVATKADRVHPDDRTRLDSLIRQMVQPLVKGRRVTAQSQGRLSGVFGRQLHAQRDKRGRAAIAIHR